MPPGGPYDELEQSFMDDPRYEGALEDEQDECRKRGLSTKGDVWQLEARVKEYDANIEEALDADVNRVTGEYQGSMADASVTAMPYMKLKKVRHTSNDMLVYMDQHTHDAGNAIP